MATNASGGSITAGGAYAAGLTGSVTDVVQVTDSVGSVATRNVAVTAAVTISPGTASVVPGGGQTFTASGGSGSGYAWSLVTDTSGGSVNATTGAYTAGSTGSVTDAVRVIDSLGNAATASVTVTAAPASAKSGGCGTVGGADVSILALGLAVALRLRRKSAGQAA